MFYLNPNKDIKLFAELFELSYIENAIKSSPAPKDSDLSALVELLSHLTCFDSYKSSLIQRRSLMTSLINTLEPWLTNISKESANSKVQNHSAPRKVYTWDYQILNGFLNITMNLTLDQMREFLEKQKKNYGVGDEELQNLRNMHKKYGGEEIPEDQSSYNEDFINKNGVRGFFCRDLKVSRFISIFLLRFGNHLSDFSSVKINFSF